MSAATDARRDRLHYRATVRAYRAAHAAALADTNLSAAGRQALTGPLAERLRDAHHRVVRDLDELVKAAEDEVTHYDPPAVLRRYGGDKPATVTAAAGFAALETPAGLLTYAKDRTAAKDYASCHGIALALPGREDLDADQRAAVLAALAEPHQAFAWRAVSSLIGVKQERLRHQTEGALGTRELASTRTLEACHEAQQYTHPGTGAPVSLSDDTVASMLKVNGYMSDIGAAEAA
jgi:hypothetical protein